MGNGGDQRSVVVETSARPSKRRHLAHPINRVRANFIWVVRIVFPSAFLRFGGAPWIKGLSVASTPPTRRARPSFLPNALRVTDAADFSTMADDVPNRGASLLGVNYFFAVLAFLTVMIRSYVRIFIMKRFSFDDAVMLVAMVRACPPPPPRRCDERHWGCIDVLANRAAPGPLRDVLRHVHLWRVQRDRPPPRRPRGAPDRAGNGGACETRPGCPPPNLPLC